MSPRDEPFRIPSGGPPLRPAGRKSCLSALVHPCTPVCRSSTFEYTLSEPVRSFVDGAPMRFVERKGRRRRRHWSRRRPNPSRCSVVEAGPRADVSYSNGVYFRIGGRFLQDGRGLSSGGRCSRVGPGWRCCHRRGARQARAPSAACGSRSASFGRPWEFSHARPLPLLAARRLGAIWCDHRILGEAEDAWVRLRARSAAAMQRESATWALSHSKFEVVDRSGVAHSTLAVEALDAQGALGEGRGVVPEATCGGRLRQRAWPDDRNCAIGEAREHFCCVGSDKPG